MRIGGIGNIYPTYVYNPNTVSADSLDKLSKISDDVLDKKVDYSKMNAQENQNPLKKGQTIDFEGVLDQQIRQGQNRAARIMKRGTEPEVTSGQTKQAVTPFPGKEEAAGAKAETERTAREQRQVISENDAAGTSQMQRAIQAYEMFMTA